MISTESGAYRPVRGVMDERIERILSLDLDLCPTCNGEGGYWEEGDDGHGYYGHMVGCTTCGGDGRVDTSPCIACGAPVYAHEDDCVAQR